jgi:thiamine monophosphate kinase
VPAKRFSELKAAADRLNLMLTTIGELSVGAGVTWSRNGREFVPSVSGFDHFAQASTQITV